MNIFDYIKWIGVPILIISTLLIIRNIGSVDECNYSPFNPSNYTSSANRRFLDKCYIEYIDYYETKKTCGTFGFSCYEASEPYTRSFRYTKCFNIKTGEDC